MVEIHAETTSEKESIGWFLDGQVNLVFGTHTHVPTADGRILKGGTAYQSDLGMTGPGNRSWGAKSKPAWEGSWTACPANAPLPKVAIGTQGCLVEIDPGTGATLAFERVEIREDELLALPATDS